jgi:hypothetical protein
MGRIGRAKVNDKNADFAGSDSRVISRALHQNPLEGL